MQVRTDSRSRVIMMGLNMRGLTYDGRGHFHDLVGKVRQREHAGADAHNQAANVAGVARRAAAPDRKSHDPEAGKQ